MQIKPASSDIAVIGMACRYPGAHDLRTFWENILTKRRQFRPFPDQRFPLSDYYDPDPSAPDKTYCGKAALIDGFTFDWIHHRIPKTAFQSSDIAHWLALDVALQALTDAGLHSTKLPRERSGVILGNSLTGEQTRAEGLRLRWPFVRRSLTAAARVRGLSEQHITELAQTMESYYKSVFAPVTEDTLAGSLSNTIAGRICNYLDLNGGGYTVDGACSSGLIAVATAATALTNRDIDLALAGGVDISLDTLELIGFAKVGALTRSDMHVYDRRGSGFIPGEGCGMVVLKRLDDALQDGDTIYAVIRGWGISSDGKGGLTAPSVKGQSIALKRAYDRAGFDPQELDFIEGHGTGTTVGDRVELEAVSTVLGENPSAQERLCGMTSLKSIIGHTKAASGIGGFIKAVIAVNQRIIPPTANCTEPNEVFETSARLLYPVVTGEVRPPTENLKAGVSAMGFGGINCHVNIESANAPSQKLAPSMEERKLLVSHQDTELFVFCGTSPADLLERIITLRNRARGISEGELIDLAALLSREFDPAARLRAACIAGTPERLLEALQRLEDKLTIAPPPAGEYMSDPEQQIFLGNTVQPCKVGFLFPGQGSQQINMARTIVERHGWARDLTAKADTWCGNYQGRKLTNYVYKTMDRSLDRTETDSWSASLRETAIAQPAICLSSLLWAGKLKRLGIQPAAAGGHSLGELTAFHVAGAFDEATLLKLAKLRGKVMGAPADESGTMASLTCSYDTAMDILSQIKGYVVVANINSPDQIVISGERASIEKAVSLASDRLIVTHLLSVSNAFHSRFVLEAAEHMRLSMEIPEVLGSTTVKLFTGIGGTRVEPGLKLRDHFVNQAISQVDFVSMVKALSRECDLLLEVGPGSVLSKLSNTITNGEGPRCLPVESRAGKDRDLNRFLGEYFVRGGAIKWDELYEGRLVRPFVPASERIFIENPCERPFALDRDEIIPVRHQGRDYPDSDVVAAGIAANNPFTSEETDFIRHLIRSELQGSRNLSAKHTEPLLQTPEVPYENAGSRLRPSLASAGRELQRDPAPAVSGGVVAGSSSAVASSPSVAHSGPSSPDRPTDQGPEVLIELASEISGFPQNSISLDHRLLDDLNLDSIKAGQFVAKALKRYGIKGAIDPTTMAKSSLQEIYDQINRHKPVAQQVHEAPADHREEQQSVAIPTHTKEDNWVRNFKVAYVEQQRTSPPSVEQVMTAASTGGKRLVIVSHDPSEPFCIEMLTLLTSHGISARASDYGQMLNGVLADYAHDDDYLFLLPRIPGIQPVAEEHARDMAARMHCIGTVITSLKKRTPKPTYAVVQFGSGDFYTSDSGLSMESKGSTAFLSSIHLENPEERIRVLEFSNVQDTSRILQAIFAELRAEEHFTIAAFDRQWIRRVPVFELAETRIDKARTIIWSRSDVVIVTGGAKGITAECALTFAMKTGVKLALVGSTALIEKNEEIQKVLQRYRENGVTYRYYACDISDKTSVRDLRRRIEKDLGAITGVIHGAAVNRPRRAEQVSLDEAIKEIAPKLFGAINLCEALQDRPPKLFVGFSSIIGVTGMMGNAWYGFSNELLNLLLQTYQVTTGVTEVISCAFSIWSDVGMGERMGSRAVLASMGIYPIPKENGVEHFMQLIERDPGVKQMIVSSRLGGLTTLRRRSLARPRNDRYLEEVLFYEKGVELETKVLLTLERDPYLRDHVFKGTHLFPTVFGVEAMVQAALAVTGIHDLDHLLLENVQLKYPIAGEHDGATEIRIRAVVEERSTANEAFRVNVGITTDQTGFAKNHFEATIVLPLQKGMEHYTGIIGNTMLDIIPEEDLYGHMLFQGSAFQRIKRIRSLDETTCVMDSAMDVAGPLPGHSDKPWMTGDPYFRDTLLQSVQIIITDTILLPVEIDRWEIVLKPHERSTYTVVTDIVRRDKDIATADVVAVNARNQVIERLQGYKTKAVENVKNALQIHDLRNPDDRDEAQVTNTLQYYSMLLGTVPPIIALRNQSGIHEKSTTERHAVERALFAKSYRALTSVNDALPSDVQFAWTEQGRPVVTGSGDLEVSFSHDERVVLCALGRAGLGCDIETITHRSEQDWKELLGVARESLFNEVARFEPSPDRAGTRIWCALEALRKATDMKDSTLVFKERKEDCVVFTGNDVVVLTFPVTLVRGRERIIAFAQGRHVAEDQDLLMAEDENDLKEPAAGGSFVHGGPQGQKVFTYQFPLSLRDNATVGGGVHFANYFHWLGKVREMTLTPISQYIADLFFNGQFMVTNFTETDITRHVRNYETMDCRVWIHDIFGVNNSSLILHFEWRKLLGDGAIIPVAYSRHQVSWVNVVGHGIVKPIACPDHFMKFLQTHDMIPRETIGDSSFRMPIAGKISSKGLGNIYHEGDILGDRDLLEESVFDTAMEHSNLAQNIYFSNYYTWQGHLIDRYLYKLSPDQYKQMGTEGQFVCIRSHVKHLREAMPFDRIAVTMKVKRLYDCGIDMYFEYFRVDPNWERVKLAHGDHTVAWVRIDSDDSYVPQKLPSQYFNAIHNRDQHKHGSYR